MADKVKLPVTGTNDPTVNLYGKLQMKPPAAIKKTVDDSFGNMNADLFNTSANTDTQGQSEKVDRQKAMARRLAKAY